MSSLIIPFTVDAHARNRINDDSHRVAKTAPTYNNRSLSYLGSKSTPSPFEMAEPLPGGIHLHFIMPDALTHGVEKDDEGIVFPTVPNRYIVTRLYVSGNKIQTKCTLIESDFYTRNQSIYPDSVAIPWFNDERPGYKWRFLGRKYDISAAPPAFAADDGYLERLTAIGAGDPMFAAYYPGCRSVFGFHDTMEGVPNNTALTYFVLGYYGDKTQNPFFGISTADECAEKIQEMHLSIERQGRIFDNCLLFGEVTNILWRGLDANYDVAPEFDQIGQAGGAPLKISVGLTSAEALSALIGQAVLKEEQPDAERFITALQYDLGDSANQIDGQFLVDDEILLHSFNRIPPLGERDFLALPKEAEPDSGFGEELHKLQAIKREHGRTARKLDVTRDKLFYVWEQFMLLYENSDKAKPGNPTPEQMTAELERICDEIDDLEAALNKSTSDIAMRQKVLESTRSDGAELIAGDEEPFFVPKDPVIMFNGLKREFAFGENGRFADGQLLCQAAPLTDAAQGDISKYFADISFIQKITVSEYKELLYQAVFLSKGITDSIGISPGITAKYSPLTVSTPFRTIILFMDWKASLSPTGFDADLNDYTATLKNWSLPHGHTTYAYTERKPDTFRELPGRIVLTPHAITNLGTQLSKYLADNPENQTAKMIAENNVGSMSFISQNLSGFNELLTNTLQCFQYPIWLDKKHDISKEVLKRVKPERLGIDENAPFIPTRGGFFRLSRVCLMGTFGQTLSVVGDTYIAKSKTYFAETTRSKTATDYALLPFSLTTPARLNADFLSAKNDAVRVNALPETSPICAIFLPEILNNRLLVYARDGRYIGMLKVVYRDKKPSSRWVAAPGKPKITDLRLAGFINWILHGNDAALSELMYLINLTLEKMPPNSASSFIWGRPIVMTRMAASFELFGGEFKFSKRMADFGKYKTHCPDTLRFPLKFGDIDRVTDGTIGVLDDADGFKKIYAPWGVEYSGTYVKSDSPNISHNDGERFFTVLMEAESALNISTGVLPVKCLRLPEVKNFAQGLFTAVELNPVIADLDGVQLPRLTFDKNARWYYFDENSQYKTAQIVSPGVTLDSDNIIADGFLVLEESE